MMLFSPPQALETLLRPHGIMNAWNYKNLTKIR